MKFRQFIITILFPSLLFAVQFAKAQSVPTVVTSNQPILVMPPEYPASFLGVYYREIDDPSQPYKYVSYIYSWKFSKPEGIFKFFFPEHAWDYEPVVAQIDRTTGKAVSYIYDEKHYWVGGPTLSPNLEVIADSHRYAPSSVATGTTLPDTQFIEWTNGSLASMNALLSEIPPVFFVGQPQLSLDWAFNKPWVLWSESYFSTDNPIEPKVGLFIPPGFDPTLEKAFLTEGSIASYLNSTVTFGEAIDVIISTSCKSDSTCIARVNSLCRTADALNLVCLYVNSYHGGKLDVAFVIDTTGSMQDDIDEAKHAASEITNAISSSGTNFTIGIVTYRDQGDAYIAKVDQSLSNNISETIAAINAITVDGGGDAPEAVYSGLMAALRFPWRDGARKVIILMGDAPPKDPEPVSGFTLAQIRVKAFSIDPVNIYSIIIGSDTTAHNAFQAISADTFGQLLTANDASEVVPAILKIIGIITQGVDNPSVAISSGNVESSSAGLPMCSDVTGITNLIVRANIEIGTVTSGAVYCRILAQNRTFIHSPAEIGNQGIINLGVIQAVDVFAINAGGNPVTQFARSAKVCLLGNGPLFFLDANQTPRHPERLPTTFEAGYTCTNLSTAGTLILTQSDGNTSPPTISQPASPIMSVGSNCYATTNNMVRLRNAPNTSSSILTNLPYNSTYQVTHRVDRWAQVIYSDTQGWISLDFVTLSGDCG